MIDGGGNDKAGKSGHGEGGRKTPEEREREEVREVIRNIRAQLARATDDKGRPVRDGRKRALMEKRKRHQAAGNDPSAGPGEGPIGAGNNWTFVGPRNINGRIISLAVHPSSGNVLYAGSADGGVWKTEDSGQTWRATMHDEDSLAIGAIAIDPDDTETIYAGTGEPVYLSLAGTPELPGGPDLAWYYAGAGVYKSMNGGGSWALTGSIANDFVFGIAVDPFDSLNVICVGWAIDGTGGLCRSTDGGTSWTTLLTGIFTDVRFDPTNSGVVYAGQYLGGVLKSTNNGANWNPRNTGLPATAQIGRVSLSIAQANSNILYVMIADPNLDPDYADFRGCWRTASAAEAPGGWTPITNPSVGSALFWGSYIEADPSDATGNIVWAGSLNVARSGDGGTSWSLVSDAYGGTQPPTHADQHALRHIPGTANSVYIANDGGVFHGLWTGGMPRVTWTKVSTGLNITQFYDLNDSTPTPSMFGGGTQDNGTLVSTGGLSWRQVFGGDGGYVCFHPTDPYTIYVQAYFSFGTRPMLSTNGGVSFANAYSGISGNGTFPASVMVMDPTSPATMFFGTTRVYRTTTGGVGAGAWSAASVVIGDVTEITIAPSSSAVIYAGVITGGLYRATDGGVTGTSFVNITPVVAGWPTRWLSGITVHPTNSNVVYVTFLGFNASATSDHVWKGTFDPLMTTWTWELRAGGLPNIPVGALVYDTVGPTLYVATDVGVFRSTDDGMSWTPFEAGLPNTAVVDLTLDPARRLLRAATHGRGVYQYRLDGPSPTVELYLRDNILDTGELSPCPRNVADPTAVGEIVRHWQCADIKVDALAYDPTDAVIDGVEFDDPEHPYTGFGQKIEDIAGITHNNPYRERNNRVYVQLHNRGPQTANNVTVKVVWADAGMALPSLPSDFWTAFPGDGFDQTNWHPVGTQSGITLEPGRPHVVQFTWNPPATVSTHACLLAMLDCPDDPLLPIAELHPDLITPFNRKVSHKNVHPEDAPPGTGPVAIRIDMSSVAQEARFYDLRLDGRVGQARIGFLLDRPTLRNESEAYEGLKPGGDARRLLDRLAEGKDTDPARLEAIRKTVAAMKDPMACEVESGTKPAVLRGILIGPNDRAPVVFFVDSEQPGTGIEARFTASQYADGQLLGGSDVVLRAASNRTRLRFKLRKVQILDDHDPWILGRGEFEFLSLVRVSADGRTHVVRRRFPAHGLRKISDRPGHNEAVLDAVLAEVAVPAGATVDVLLQPIEHDFFTPDDRLARYRRTFTGSPETWSGIYQPGDEAADPETMADWRIWLEVTRV